MTVEGGATGFSGIINTNRTGTTERVSTANGVAITTIAVVPA